MTGVPARSLTRARVWGHSPLGLARASAPLDITPWPPSAGYHPPAAWPPLHLLSISLPYGGFRWRHPAWVRVRVNPNPNQSPSTYLLSIRACPTARLPSSRSLCPRLFEPIRLDTVSPLFRFRFFLTPRCPLPAMPSTIDHSACPFAWNRHRPRRCVCLVGVGFRVIQTSMIVTL